MTTADTILLQPVHDAVNVRRHQLQEKRNLPAAHLTDMPPHTVAIVARESGSFPAVRSSSGHRNRTSSTDTLSIPVQSSASGEHDDKSASKSWEK